MKKGKDYIGVGVGGVLISEGKILLLKRVKAPETGCWTIPGGTLEFNETLEDCIIREVEEELGIVVRVKELLCITNHIVPQDKVHWVSPAFLLEIISGIPENKEPNCHSDMRWFPIDVLPMKLTKTAENSIISYFKKYKTA